MPPLKPCLDCGALSDRSRCPKHRTEKERERTANRTPRGDRYGEEHEAERARWVQRLALGAVVMCRRGDACLLTDHRIYPNQRWDLGHPDELCTAPLGPEHVRCNRNAAGRLSHVSDH